MKSDHVFWYNVNQVLPPEGVEVLTKIDDSHGTRNIQALTRRGNLYFAGNMYVYYTPTHWCSQLNPFS